MVVSGYVHSAGIDSEEFSNRRDLNLLRHQAATVENQFLGDARRGIDELIEQLAEQNCSAITRYRYEVLLLLYLVFLIGRIGHNFFWSSFLAPIVGNADHAEPLLTVDFYIPAMIFLVMWSAMLVLSFTWRLRRGLSAEIHKLAQSMVETRISEGLFPAIDHVCQSVIEDEHRLKELLERTSRFRRELAEGVEFLGGQRR